MSDKTVLIGLYAVAALQVYMVMFTAPQRSNMIKTETASVASRGQDSFVLYGREVTMLGGIRSGQGSAGCSVALADSETGDFVEETTGLLLDAITDKPIRISIGDCTKLPPIVFLAYERK